MPEDQVTDPVETSEPVKEQAGALDGEQETQGETTQVSEEEATAEAQPTVEELIEQNKKLQADLEKGTTAYRDKEAEINRLQEQLRPYTEKEREQLEARVKDDEAFQARVEQVGYAQATRELVQAQNRLDQMAQADQFAAMTIQQQWDKATTDTDAYAADKGITSQQLQLLRAQYGNFPAATAEQSLELAKLAIDKEAGVKVSATQNENALAKAETEVRRKMANQNAAGVSTGGVEQPAGQMADAQKAWEAEKAEMLAAAKKQSGDVI